MFVNMFVSMSVNMFGNMFDGVPRCHVGMALATPRACQLCHLHVNEHINEHINEHFNEHAENIVVLASGMVRVYFYIYVFVMF